MGMSNFCLPRKARDLLELEAYGRSRPKIDMDSTAKPIAANQIATLKHSIARALSRWCTALFAGFPRCAGVVLALLGAGLLTGAAGHSQLLALRDPIFGIAFRDLMLILGTVQLSASFILLFTSCRKFGLVLAAWISADFLVYRARLWNLGWHSSSGFMVHALGLSPSVTDRWLSFCSLLVMAGSCTVLLADWQRARATQSQKMHCPACGGHIGFPLVNLGRTAVCPHCKIAVTLRRADENLKTSCVYCKGHIEFPAHALGQKLQCPHCRTEITLKEPAPA
jgi:hypothetical protein